MKPFSKKRKIRDRKISKKEKVNMKSIKKMIIPKHKNIPQAFINDSSTQEYLLAPKDRSWYTENTNRELRVMKKRGIAMLPSLEFKDIESFAEYLGRNEILQQNNPNANARLFIVECQRRVAKIYNGSKNETENGEKITFAPDVEKNIENLIKISELLSTNLFPQLALPTALISFCGQTVGYEMPYISGVDLGAALADPRYSHEQKVGWFNQLADIILSLPDGVFVGDLHSQNVLVRKDGTIALIDVDGFSLASNNLLTCPAMFIEDLPSKYYDAYGCLKISRETDVLCLFRMFFRYLFEGQDIAYFSPNWKARLPEYLEKRGIHSDLIAAVSTLFSDEENVIQPGMFTCWNDISPTGEYQRFLALTGLDNQELMAAEYINAIINRQEDDLWKLHH